MKNFDINNYVKTKLPTKYGDFMMYAWKYEEGLEPVALTTLNIDNSKVVMVRIHSECLTGDTFGTLLCDCGAQKEKALNMIFKSGNGVFIYDRQEGRGIGLCNKLKALNLQEKGLDTYEANRELGFLDDERDYDISVKILNFFSINQIELLSNNPKKFQFLVKKGFSVLKRHSITINSNKYNEKYLADKIIIGGHYL